LSSTGASDGLSRKYCVTPLGSELRCGTSEPGTAAMASMSSRNRAVRMLVSWRQANRIQPTNPSLGCSTELSSFVGCRLALPEST
jgi:hypothetical protein